MFFGNLNSPDWNFIHKKIKVNESFTKQELEDYSKNFVHEDFIEVNPLFYYDDLNVSDKEAVISPNHILLENNPDTVFTFKSENNVRDIIQVFINKMDNYWLIFVLDKWCNRLNDVKLRICSVENENINNIFLEETVWLNGGYEGDLKTLYTDEPATKDLITENGVVTYITDETIICVEITVEDNKFCFKCEE